jgi:signal transduction histidine kinase
MAAETRGGLSAHMESVREAERVRIAREIHDELGAALTALKMDLSWCAARLPKHRPELNKKVRAMIQAVDSTIQAVKRITTELRPSILDDFGSWAAIKWQAQQFEARTGIRCQASITTLTNELELEPERASALFRIVQEALTNIARHSGASQARITASASNGMVALMIEDNGRGIEEADLAAGKSWGILGMRERARSYGGRVEVIGTPGQGTKIEVRMPCAKSPPAVA